MGRTSLLKVTSWPHAAREKTSRQQNAVPIERMIALLDSVSMRKLWPTVYAVTGTCRMRASPSFQSASCSATCERLPRTSRRLHARAYDQPRVSRLAVHVARAAVVSSRRTSLATLTSGRRPRWTSSTDSPARRASSSRSSSHRSINPTACASDNRDATTERLADCRRKHQRELPPHVRAAIDRGVSGGGRPYSKQDASGELAAMTIAV